MLSFEELNSFLGRSEHLPTDELMQAFQEVDEDGSG
jgi:hypothetical protein